MSASTGSCRCCLPIIEFDFLGKTADFGLELTKFIAIFDCATELHAALVFLLTTGFRCAVAFFVGLSHFESPKAITGVSR